jgi:hypothetical protein
VRRLVRWVLSLSKIDFLYVGGVGWDALNCGCGITYGVFLSMFILNVWPHFALSMMQRQFDGALRRLILLDSYRDCQTAEYSTKRAKRGLNVFTYTFAVSKRNCLISERFTGDRRSVN